MAPPICVVADGERQASLRSCGKRNTRLVLAAQTVSSRRASEDRVLGSQQRNLMPRRTLGMGTASLSRRADLWRG